MFASLIPVSLSLRVFNNLGKDFRLVYRDVCQDLAVDIKPLFVHVTYQATIGGTVQSCCCVNANNPETTVLTFFQTTTTIGMFPSLFDVVLGNGPDM